MRTSTFNVLHLLLPILLLLPKSSNAYFSNTLPSGQSLGFSDTLISANSRFLLSFFTPSSSPNRYYLALSYRQVPNVYIWVANRDNPATDLSVTLVLSSSGDLSLTQLNSTVILHLFKSNLTTPNTNQLFVKLENNGDLVLFDPNSRTHLWRGFNQMTNTLLPGMYMSLDRRTKKNHNLTSWRSPDDPSTGDVSFSIRQGQQDAFEAYVMSPNGTVYYRVGPWNGFRFSGHVGMYSTTKSGSLHYFFLIGEDEVTYSYKPLSGDTIIVRLYVLQEGVLIREIWNFLEEKWHTLWTLPSDYCDYYNVCGNNGLCENDRCVCLPGFVPYRRRIAGHYVQKRCVRKESLPCGMEKVGFVEMKGMKLPDTTNTSANGWMSVENCRNKCELDCNCTAYALNNSTGKGVGCYIWRSDLVDVRRMGGTELDVLYVKYKDGGVPGPLLVGAMVGIVVGSIVGGVLGYIAYRLWVRYGSKASAFYFRQN